MRTQKLAIALACVLALPASAQADENHEHTHDHAESSVSSFNPEAALILQGAYKKRKKLEERHIGGFVNADHDGHGHGENKRGFTYDHTELKLGAGVAPYWRGQAMIALFEGKAELEEAWLQSAAQGFGTKIKAGRFLSGIGYLNEQHMHQWDFYEQPLMYKALFGGHGYAQEGVQLKWVAPLDKHHIELGAEIGRGKNFPSGGNVSGANSHALFAHVGGDIDASNNWRIGLSWLRTRANERESHFETDHGEVPGAFSGRSRVWIADFVYKWSPDGKPERRNFKFQAEYFRRTENGNLAVEDDDTIYDSVFRTKQSGYYFAGAYQFTPKWRAGLRFDHLSSGQQSLGNNPANIETVRYRPRRVSAMVDYSWSESSHLRLQWSRDRTMPGVTDNQVTLQYAMSLGSHGAHRHDHD